LGKWCKLGYALLRAAFASETSHAQSSADTAGNGRFLMGPGGMSESRWGMKGVQDPGGGQSTFFKLENRFFLNNGQSDPTMAFFNEAQIGLQSTSYGQVV
jgi:predicted porin